MLKPYKGKMPKLGEGVFVEESAQVVGDGPVQQVANRHKNAARDGDDDDRQVRSVSLLER